MSNQRNVESFCLSEAVESSLEVSAHSGQLLESNNDVEPKKCGKLLSVNSGHMSNQRCVENFCPPTQISCWESSNNVKPKKRGKLLFK